LWKPARTWPAPEPDSVIGTYNTILTGPAFLALRVDALLRLGRAGEAAAAV
jgi:hypothetical protein